MSHIGIRIATQTHQQMTIGQPLDDPLTPFDDDDRGLEIGVEIERVEFLETDAPDLTMLPHLVEAASRLREVAATGNAEAAVAQLRASRLLAAHRTGPSASRTSTSS